MSIMVLVVDDDKFDRRLMRRGLDMDTRGFECIDADGADEALFLAKAMPDPSVIITDLRMPVMDGFDLIKELKSDITTQRFPIIALSTSAGLDDRAKALKLGASDLMKKPSTKTGYHKLATKIRDLARDSLPSQSLKTTALS